ncbi:MAG: TonB-dependent receptor [Deltaproteobacteria bacterium]|nr:TonB-dependent receptor [Deltaproteobacteria bacterium]
MITIALALALGTLSAGAPPACDDTVAGRVVDDVSGEPIAGAVVRLGEATVRTDDSGHFVLSEVCPGDHGLTVERTDYETVQREVDVQGHTQIDVHALPREVEHDDHILVKVTAPTPVETRASSTIEGEALARARGRSFADSLAGVAGVSVLRSSAGGLGKPVIRGQYGRRNLILTDGIRHEGQQWGIDHAPEVDPFSAGSITVIKGAGSIRYGPDAVGGVVLVKPPSLPREPGIYGQTHLIGVSNGRQGTAAMRVDGAHAKLPGLAWRVEGNATRGAAQLTPDYPLDNTGALTWNGGGTVGYLGKGVTATLSYRRHFQKAGLCTCLRNDTPDAFANSFSLQAPVGADLYTSEYRIERAFQRVIHDLAVARARVSLGRAGVLSATYAFQDNHRQEFDTVRQGVQGAQLALHLRTHAGDVAFDHRPLELSETLWLEGTVGAGAARQVNEFDANQTLIPDYEQWSGGVFVLERVVTVPFEFQLGGRYDGLQRTSTLGERDYIGQTGTGRLDPDDCVSTDNGGGRCRFPFHTASASAGALIHATEDLDLRADFASAARMPKVDEQFLNGVAPSFPVLGLGGSSLGIERTWGSSVTVSYANRWLATETSGYLNYIDDYIYFAPELSDGALGLNETIRGPFPVFTFRPVDAVFYGGEHAFTVAPPKWPVSIEGQAALVRARDVQNRRFLVFVPADRYQLGVTYRWPDLWKLRDGFVSVGGTFVDRQRRFDLVADFAPPPPAYFLLGASAGIRLPLNDQVLSLGLEGNNITNASYRQYTSLLRYFADEPGWELRLRLSLDFLIRGRRQRRARTAAPPPEPPRGHDDHDHDHGHS